MTVETLAWMIGPVVGGADADGVGTVRAVRRERGDVPRLRRSRRAHPGEQAPLGGVADARALARRRRRLKLVVTARPLRTVLVVWNVALIGSAAVNVAEVVFAKDTLDAGNLGFGALVAASGVGLALGSFLSAPALGESGFGGNYVGSIVLMGVGWGAAALSRLDLARRCLRRRRRRRERRGDRLQPAPRPAGAPDQYRGRALATIMSSNYAVLGLAMAAAGVLTDVVGARAVWIGAGVRVSRRGRSSRSS